MRQLLDAVDSCHRDPGTANATAATLCAESQSIEIVARVLLDLSQSPLLTRRPACEFDGRSMRGAVDAHLLALALEEDASRRRGLAYALWRVVNQEIKLSRIDGVPAVSGNGKPFA